MRGCSRGVSTLAKSLRLTPRTSTSSAYPGLSRSSSTFGSVRYRRAEVLRTPCLQQRQFSDAFIGKPIQQKPILPLQSLPFSCPGCGALTQWINADDAGFYSPNRKAVKAWLRRLTPRPVSASPSEIERGEDVAVAKDIEVVSGNGAVQDDSGLGTSIDTSLLRTPVCDRCHNLVNYSQARSIFHPEIDSIADTLAESPYKHNHIYHVLDAADFPLSLVRNIHRQLDLVHQRSQNRRARHTMFRGGRTNTMSFIITRSDLLAPQKEQVDSLMPYVTDVLRAALGKVGDGARLGNVHLVSAKRGWWTTGIKEEIRQRGGGNWMVGKVNVGKSNLFEGLFPKNKDETVSHAKLQQAIAEGHEEKAEKSVDEKVDALLRLRDGHKIPQQGQQPQKVQDPRPVIGAIDSLLPPLQPEVQYPVMPLVSSLPGTTASPIRLPFGDGKGELIDLPGLSRGQLENYVEEDHKEDLVMTKRPKPEQLIMKPGQSLLLGGGLIRITPVDAEDVILAYAFTPIEPHITSTEKAIGTQLQQRESGLTSIVKQGAAEAIKSAGIYPLDSDVTKQRSHKLIAAGRSLESLPFRILATDILIEGVGWVELAAQVRKKSLERATSDSDAQHSQIGLSVEVFSPEGKSIGSRKSMCAWLFTNKARSPGPGQRPRRSMKGAKKAAKVAKRVATSSES